MNKKMLGQFFTITNPFDNDLFYKWKKKIKNFDDIVILEPFAGSNNIVKLLNNIGINNNFSCYDIDDSFDNCFPRFPIQKNDSIKNYPINFSVVITNPPYLAKNSATRNGIPYPNSEFDDLYKICLNEMLLKTDYVAAIIPESFLTQNIFHERLYGVVSLNARMFSDTECPVCLALFLPEEQKKELIPEDFYIYKNNAFIGMESELKKGCLTLPKKQIQWKFNKKGGRIGLIAIDNSNEQSILFVQGETINDDKIKHSSRGITKIDNLVLDNIDINSFISKCNMILREFREKTQDVFLTSFKGLRKDGNYRRRLDFLQAKIIMSIAYEEMIHA
jgi:hypothetical protein